MRTPVTAKTPIETKPPAKGQVGLLVRLPIKKIYCTKCKKLAKGKLEGSGIATKISCPKCNLQLRSWSGTAWKGEVNGDSAS